MYIYNVMDGCDIDVTVINEQWMNNEQYIKYYNMPHYITYSIAQYRSFDMEIATSAHWFGQCRVECVLISCRVNIIPGYTDVEFTPHPARAAAVHTQTAIIVTLLDAGPRDQS